MSEVKIEKGVPMPVRSLQRDSLYPWKQMEVGDSFVMQSGKSPNHASNMMRYQRQRTGRQYSSRTQADGTIRIWRVS